MNEEDAVRIYLNVLVEAMPEDACRRYEISLALYGWPSKQVVRNIEVNAAWMDESQKHAFTIIREYVERECE